MMSVTLRQYLGLTVIKRLSSSFLSSDTPQWAGYIPARASLLSSCFDDTSNMIFPTLLIYNPYPKVQISIFRPS